MTSLNSSSLQGQSDIRKYLKRPGSNADGSVAGSASSMDVSSVTQEVAAVTQGGAFCFALTESGEGAREWEEPPPAPDGREEVEDQYWYEPRYYEEEESSEDSAGEPDLGMIEQLEQANLEVTAMGSSDMLIRPCVDCGLMTGRFCDYCRARERLPKEEWAPGQMTPLCSDCDNRERRCHFCRKQKWACPPPHERERRAAPGSSSNPSSSVLLEGTLTRLQNASSVPLPEDDEDDLCGGIGGAPGSRPGAASSGRRYHDPEQAVHNSRMQSLHAAAGRVPVPVDRR